MSQMLPAPRSRHAPPEDERPLPAAKTPLAVEELRAAAAEYRAWGWNVMPLRLDVKNGRKNPHFPEPWARFQSDFVDEETFARLLAKVENPNALAAITGNASGIFVVDVDDPSGAWAQEHLSRFQGIARAQTGRGFQLYFAHKDGLRSTTGRLAPGIDTKGEGGVAFVPPSWHPTAKRRYRWVVPAGEKLAEVPAWLIQRLEAASIENVPIEGLLEGVREGQRNRAAAELAGRLFAQEQSVPTVRTRLREWNLKNQPPLPEDELDRVLNSIEGRERGGGKPSFFVPRQRDGSRFVPSKAAEHLARAEQILVWERGEGGKRELWVYRQDLGVYRRGEHYLEKKLGEALGHEDSTYRCRETLDHLRRVAWQEGAGLNPPEYQHLINLENGMLDWQAGTLLPHDPKYWSSVQLPVRYDPSAQSPEIDRFLNDLFPQEALLLVEELLGYLLVCGNQYKAAFVLLGPGHNGKTKFLLLASAFVGDANTSQLSLQQVSENRFMRAELDGRLLNIYDDLGTRPIRDADVFKALTGDGSITVERKHEHPFEMKPTAVFLFATNQMPQSYDHTYAYHLRWVIIPCPNFFLPGKNADPNILQGLTTQNGLSRLLNRALEGRRRLVSQGDFTRSEVVRKAGEDYERTNDPVREFVQEGCVLEQGGWASRQDLYEGFCRFTDEPMANREFQRELKPLVLPLPGVAERQRRMSGKPLRGYQGISVSVA